MSAINLFLNYALPDFVFEKPVNCACLDLPAQVHSWIGVCAVSPRLWGLL